MNTLFKKTFIAVSLVASAQAMSQISMELEEACYGDIGLGDYIYQVIDNSDSGANTDVVNEEEANQIAAILADEPIAALSESDKAEAVLTACAEGRILQTRHATIINQQ